ncbi:hypothetical protein HDU97_006374 [Phlyctochytrium planicorne]|nr:hypothetical protein HDU97_006374 [Phlyctochytrium planicorne]
MSIFDFERQFVGYAAYHNNKVNQMIHFVCVPIILWTAMVWLGNTPAVAEWPLSNELPLNAAFFLTIIYALYYIALHQVIGGLMAPILVTMLYTSNLFLNSKTEINPNVIAAGLHITSWIFQFLGHGVAEKRRPALMDNLLHAAVLAPFFVFSEFMFAAGYDAKTAQKLQAQTDKAIAEFKASLKKKE